MRGLPGVFRDRIRPRPKKIALGIVLFFALLTVLGFFVLPPVLKYVLIKELSESLRRKVTIDRISTNPYALSLTAKGLEPRT